jgi:DNA-binding MarR family transcriptional regulator
MIHQSQVVTIPEMAKKLKITKRGVEKNIKKLKENKLLDRKEGERGVFWELLVD